MRPPEFNAYNLPASDRLTWYFIFISFFFLFLFPARAQSIEFKNYSTKDGLITDEVYNMHQDRQGYIWIFSRLGVMKYNGAEFKPVLKNLPVSECFVYNMYENKEGRKWVANSHARIYEIRNDSAIMIKGIETISASIRNAARDILQLCVDDSLQIYACTRGHSYKFVPKNGIYYPIDLSQTLKDTTVRIKILEVNGQFLEIVRLEKDEEFVYYPNKRKFVFANSNKSYELPYSQTYVPVSHLKKFRNSIYFTARDRLGKITETGQIVYIPVGSYIINYCEDQNHHLWLGCLNNGVYELNEKDSIVHHYLENTTINDLLIDHQHGLWVSTPGLGLFRCENLKDQYFEKTEPLGEPISFIKEVDRRLFIATKKGDIFSVEQNSWTPVRQADNISPMDIVKQNQDYFILLSNQLEKYKSTGGKFLRTSLIKQGANYALFSGNGDSLICIWRRGLTLNINGVVKERIDFKRKITCAMLTGQVSWFGTENGAYAYSVRLSPDKLLPVGEFFVADSLRESACLAGTKGYVVTHIVKDAHSSIWFCTIGNGLFQLTGNQVTKYDQSNGLPSNIINDISFTKEHLALLSTNKGLYISKPTGVNRYGNWEAVYPGNVKSAAMFGNKIYASVRDGLLIINSVKERNEAAKVFLNLACIKIHAKEISPGSFKKLNSRQENVEFKFDLVTFVSIKPRLRYHLTGSLTESGFVTDANLKFERLVPGNYTLTVFPQIREGEKLKLVLPFEVEPAFWQTAWFKILVVLMILLIIIISSRLIIQRNQRKAALKTKNEQLILEYKLIALKAQINPHFMSNCLSAIQLLIKDGKSDKATSYIAKFGLMVRKILDFSSKPVITLKEELELMTIYLELEQLRFESQFTSSIVIGEGVSLRDTFLPPLILNPLVENAIWHGLLPVQKLRPGILQISVKRENDLLILTIEDNGVGRNPKKQGLSNSQTNSYGVKITEQRLSNINYLFKTNTAKLVYEDLTGPDHHPSGTRVTIYLPLNLTPFQHEPD